MTTILHRPIALAALLASVFVIVNLAGTESSLDGGEEYDVPYVALYAEPETAAERLVNQGDGQAFAALAQDPTLSRPEVFAGGAERAAYRAQRPVLGWLVWGSTGGQSSLVPVALFVWAVIGAAVLVAGVKALASERGRRSELAVLALALPGSLINLDWSGPEALATGLALLGLWRWERSDTVGAVALLTAATLTRETLLFVAAALVVHALWRHRRLTGRILALSVCPAMLALWWLVLRWRLAAWPTDAGEGRLSLPLRGLVDGVSAWGFPDALFALLAVGLVLLAWRRWRPGEAGEQILWSVLLAHVALGLVMGAEVWKRWEDFGRPLLPLYAVALVLALPEQRNDESVEQVFTHSAGQDR